MAAAKYVGRVGALAIAMGVGVAVATGVASADTPGSAADPPSVSADSPGSSTVDAVGKESGQGTGDSPKSTKRIPKPDREDLGRIIRRIVDKGVALNTGGAHLHAKAPKAAPADDAPGSDPVDGAPGVQPDRTIGSKGSQGPATPTRNLAAQLGSGATPTKSARRLDVTAPRASRPTPVLAAPTQVAEVVERQIRTQTAAANVAIDAVAQRVADTVVSTTRALQDPVIGIRAASLERAAPTTRTVAALSVPSLLSGVLAAVGFSPSAANSPLAPAEPAALVALLAWGSRRELEESFASPGATITTSGTPVVNAAQVAAPAAVVTPPVTTRIGWVTGEDSVNKTATRFGIAGTDVGVIWDNGVTGDNPATKIVERREVLMAFGDTFSGPNQTGTWRMNTLLRSADHVLSDGLNVPDGITNDPGAYSGSPMTNPNFSREIIGNYHYGIGSEVTMIPTAGISVPGAGANGATRQYVNFMAVKSWDSPGRWTTNYSAIAYSDDNGQNWTVVPASSVRAARAGATTTPYVAGNQNFQQGAYVKPPAGSPEAAAGWVYSYGTPAGRAGTVYLSRVNQKDILDQTKYQYWNGSTWVANKPSAATPVLPGTTTSSFFGLIKTTTYPSAGELSVQYNPYLKKYVMLYADGNNNVVMRTSATPQGTWSAPKTLVTSTQYPGLYAPMIHPWSGTDQLKKADGTTEDPKYLYWDLSQWNEYNVALMRTDLSRV